MQTVQKNIALAPLTTFQIGGAARYFVEVANVDEIREALAWANERGLSLVVLAGGSNVLVPDTGIDALVMKIVSKQSVFKDTKVSADAGCNLLELIREAGACGIGGWEKLSGIPGTIGGAVRGNAGAFGPEIKDFVTSVQALNSKTQETCVFENSKCDFSYRHSFFKDHPEWIILDVIIALRQIDASESARSTDETIQERERRHLQNVKAAGSYFMNPKAPDSIIAMFESERQMKSREGRVPAGWLIEKAGMKGATVGGAIASLQHPNYLVNQGNATAKDVLELAEKVKAAVKSQFNVELHEEAAVL